MTKEDCQEIHVVGREYPEKYDGVWDWYCRCTQRSVLRWKMTKDGRRTSTEDETAFDILCDDCEIPSQD